MRADVVVVGAGLSGLVCATRLKQAGADVVVLEARERVGGRALNVSIAPDRVVELGGQWAGPHHDAIRRVAAEVGVATFPTHIHGRHLFGARGRTTSYRGDVPARMPLALLDYRLAQARLDRMARRVSLESPADSAWARRCDTTTAQAWLDRSMHTPGGRSLMRLSILAVLAAEPSELSLLHWLFYLATGGGLNSLIRTEGGYQQDRFVGGSQEIAHRLASQLGACVRLGAPVRRIVQDDRGLTVASDPLEVDAAAVVVAIAPALTATIEFMPALPADRLQLAQRMPGGSVMKFVAVYPQPFWRDAGLSGHSTSIEGPIAMTFDNSPPDGQPGALVAFAVGAQARALSRVSEQVRRDAVLGHLAELFGSTAGQPIQFHEMRWAAEPWTRGCYAGYFGPGGWTDFSDALREPVGRVHWASAETAVVAQGSMDGAVTAGERAAAEAMTQLGLRVRA